MLKIEGDDVSAIEVVQQIIELEQTLKQRKEDNFLPPPAVAERNMLIENGYSLDELTAVCNDFFGNFYENQNINYNCLLTFVHIFNK